MSNRETSRVKDFDRVSDSAKAVFRIFRRGTVGVVFGVQESDTWLSYD